jgi:hypothetical protein
MNKGDFFVMLTTPNGGYTPLELCTSIANNEATLAKFKTEDKAREAANSSVLGTTFGYEVFEIGMGC